MKAKKSLILLILSLVSILTLSIFVISIFITNPTRLGPGGVTLWFINILLMFASTFSLSLYLIRKSKVESKSKLLISSVRTGSLVAFAFTLLMALSSLRSLSWRDIILLVLLVVLVELYFRTRREA